MTDQATRPEGSDSSDQLGPSVPNDVMVYVHAYGDSRADEDGLSALRIGEAVLALRRWAAQLQAVERDRIDELLRTHEGISVATLEYLQKMREGPSPEEWAELDRNARA